MHSHDYLHSCLHLWHPYICPFQHVISSTESHGFWSQASSSERLTWHSGLSFRAQRKLLPCVMWASHCHFPDSHGVCVCGGGDDVIFYSIFPNTSVIRMGGTANANLRSLITRKEQPEGQHLACEQYELCVHCFE